MNPIRAILILTVLGTVFTADVWASAQVGTLTQVDGTVKLFTHPSKKLDAAAEKDSEASGASKAPHALFEGEFFRVEDAKVGDRVQLGNILRTAPGAKARVVYDNGDQFSVGPATAYRIFWNKDTVNTTTQVQLMYGKIRGVVEHGGPRSHLRVKTASVTMGVRGTDFFIADDGNDGATEVSIIRGSVDVKPEAPKSKPVEVKAGYSVEVPHPAQAVQVEAKTAATPLPSASGLVQKDEAPKAMEPAPMAPEIELRRTTQEDLVAIQKSSRIEPKKEDPATAPVMTAKVTEEIKKLEKKAVETTMNDIKIADPKLFAQLEKGPAPKSADDINTHAVAQLVKEAPKAPKERKPFKSELEDLDQGAYDKYFKILD